MTFLCRLNDVLTSSKGGVGENITNDSWMTSVRIPNPEPGVRLRASYIMERDAINYMLAVFELLEAGPSWGNRHVKFT